MYAEKHRRSIDDYEDFASDDSLLAPRPSSFVRPPRKRTWLPWLLHLVLLSISASLAFYAWQVNSTLPADARRYAEHKHKQWTSIFGDTPETFTQTRFDGQFALQNTYKGPPTAKVDAAWKRLMPAGPLKVNEDAFANFNASRYSVKVPEQLGDGYLAYFESAHYIHCVYTLWQTTYPEFYTSQQKWGEKNPEAWHEHLDHCADLLRQKLMCDADVGMFGFNWIKGQLGPHANFNVQHQCRDYEQVLEYMNNNQADKDRKHQSAFLRPSDRPTVNYKESPYDPFAKGDTEVGT